jgi:SAM-dependent methyltransferase
MDRSLYEEHALLESDHWWFVARRSILSTVLARHLPETPGPRRILDVGCGTGGMLPMLASFGEVSGIEGEELAVEHCAAAFGQFDVRRGDIPDDVPDDGSFDVATAFDVIEHTDDDLGALRALRAAVHPGGTVVVTVPALSWLWSDHDVVNGHKRRYTRATLLDVVTSSTGPTSASSTTRTSTRSCSPPSRLPASRSGSGPGRWKPTRTSPCPRHASTRS